MAASSSSASSALFGGGSSTNYGGTAASDRLGIRSSMFASGYRSGYGGSSGDGAAPYIAEFLGTFIVVFAVGCIVLSPGNPVWSPVAIGCVLMAMIYATANVSGGNLNPAVTFSLGLIGHLRWVVVVRYWLAQFGAGILAALCAHALFSPDRPRSVTPIPPFTWEYAVTAEVIFTFLLCFVFNNCFASKRNNPREDANQFYAVAMGFATVAGGYAANRISGAAFNPAIAIGLSTDGVRWSVAWIVAEFVGAVLAAIMFRAVRPEEYNPPEGACLAEYEPRLHVRCASESLGTFMVVLTFGLNLTMATPAKPFSSAAVLACFMYSLGNVSGAHLNPVVTMSVVLSGRDKCSPADGAAYIVCQVLSGACAGLLYAQYHSIGPNSGLTFALAPGATYGPNAAGVVELFFAFILAYAYLACATAGTPGTWRTKQRFYVALVIGSCVLAGGIAVGPISGGEFNPAISVGVATANLAHSGRTPAPPFASCIVLSLWQLTGGLLASVVFSLTYPDEYKKAPLLAQ